MVYVQQFSLLGQTDGKTKHRLEHQAGLSLLKTGLAREYQIIISDMEKEITPGFKGKPYLHNNPEIFFNISHGGVMAACGLDQNPLGVDVEEIRPVKSAIWKRVLTEGEQLYLEQYSGKKQDREFFRIWTLKESYAKALGLGLALDFTSLSCHLVSDDKSVQHYTEDKPVQYFPGDGPVQHFPENKSGKRFSKDKPDRNFAEKEPVQGAAENVLIPTLSEKEFVSRCLKERVRRIPGKRFREGLDGREECFWMDEVNVEQMQNERDCPWHFFQTVLEERFVISCCCRLPFL